MPTFLIIFAVFKGYAKIFKIGSLIKYSRWLPLNFVQTVTICFIRRKNEQNLNCILRVGTVNIKNSLNQNRAIVFIVIKFSILAGLSNSRMNYRALTTSFSEQTQLFADVAADPTLPRTKSFPCPKCGHREAAFFQSRARRADTTMSLYYVCCNASCGYRWME